MFQNHSMPDCFKVICTLLLLCDSILVVSDYSKGVSLSPGIAGFGRNLSWLTLTSATLVLVSVSHLFSSLFRSSRKIRSRWRSCKNKTVLVVETLTQKIIQNDLPKKLRNVVSSPSLQNVLKMIKVVSKKRDKGVSTIKYRITDIFNWK